MLSPRSHNKAPRHEQSADAQLRASPKPTTKLAATGYAALQNVYCEAREDTLILSGVVPSYYMKQVAQTVAGKMDGIKHIENCLEVRSPR